MNFRSLIQPSEILPVELIETRDAFNFSNRLFLKKKKKTFQIDLQMSLSSSLIKITIIYKTSIIPNYSIAKLRSLSLWMLSNLITH